MPLRGYKNENPREWERLNKLLETAFKAEKDHRFMKLHQQKPIEDDWSRLYEYVPGEEEILQINVNIEEPKVVGHFGLYNQDMQYGKAILKNGGGRDVGTHPIVRGKGIGSLLAQDVRKFMRENKVDISILFSGAGHFYEKNGWRGGMQVPSFTLKGEKLEEILRLIEEKQPTNQSEQNKRDYSCEILENNQKTLKDIAELYSKTNEGLYFAAHRDFDYWKRHIKTNPGILWSYLTVKNKSRVLGYVRFELKKNNSQKVQLEINECRISHDIPPGVNRINIIFQKIVNFVKKEAIGPEEYLESILFNLSKDHTIIEHLRKSFPESLTKAIAYKMNVMCLIGDPYSLMRRLQPEILDRFRKGLLPEGNCWIKFDQSGRYSGGALVQNTINGNIHETKVLTTEKEKKIQKWREKYGDGLVFEDLSTMTIFFANYIPHEELENDEEIEDYGAKIFGKGGNWLRNFFKGVEYSMYDLDHF